MSGLPKGLTDEQLNPQPPIWPQCERCFMPYVLRRSLSFTTVSYRWAWMRDCAKPRSYCKGAKAIMVGPNGPVEQSDGSTP